MAEPGASRHLLTLLLSAVLLLAGVLTGCARPAPEPVVVGGIAYHSMSWQAHVSALPEGLTAEALQARLQSRVDAANRVLSTYQHDTELMRLNAAPAGVWVPLGPLLGRTLARALRVSAATDGAYDITIGPLVNLWGFGPGGRPRQVPSGAEIASARASVGWHHVELAADASRLRKQRPVVMDLSSVGEGAGVDDLAAALDDLGIHDYLVGIAGSLRSKGLRPDGRPWRLAIEQPDGSGRPAQLLNLPQGGAISTSGSYRNYFETDGVRYSHTIDPATGRPIQHRGVSVTVVSPDPSDDTLADAWATALNVLGPERGLALAEAQGLAAYFIERTDAGFRSWHTSAFKPFLAP